MHAWQHSIFTSRITPVHASESGISGRGNVVLKVGNQF